MKPESQSTMAPVAGPGSAKSLVDVGPQGYDAKRGGPELNQVPSQGSHAHVHSCSDTRNAFSNVLY